MSWRLAQPQDMDWVTFFLRDHEPYSVSASSLLRMPKSEFHFWISDTCVVGVRHSDVLIPVGIGVPEDLPDTEKIRMKNNRITLIGTLEWIKPWEEFLEEYWRCMDYWFLARAQNPCTYMKLLPEGNPEFFQAGPDHLGSLFTLQAEYEKEEVIFDPLDFEISRSRTAFAYQLKTELNWALRIQGKMIAKAGSNAKGVRWVQLGGVYTVPQARRKGYAYFLLSQIIQSLSEMKMGVCLFVKKTNIPALNLYKELGFDKLGSFRIVYYA